MILVGNFLASVQGIGSVSSVGLLGPLSLTLLFVGVSVDLTETRQLKNKTKEYESYRRKAPSAIFLWPPRAEEKKTE